MINDKGAKQELMPQLCPSLAKEVCYGEHAFTLCGAMPAHLARFFLDTTLLTFRLGAI